LSGRVFQALGAAMLKARSPNLSRDRGRNKSRFNKVKLYVNRISFIYYLCLLCTKSRM